MAYSENGGYMISAKFTFKIGGKEVSDSQFAEKLAEGAMEAAKENVCSQVEAVRCSVHDQNAKVVFKEGSGGLNYEIEGCCDELRERAIESLASH
jgi:(p)ppGpp synthase/HD superfamily hydrolase